jgi:hypothetical protein
MSFISLIFGGELPFVMTDIKEYEYIDIVNEQSPLYLQR